MKLKNGKQCIYIEVWYGVFYLNVNINFCKIIDRNNSFSITFICLPNLKISTCKTLEPAESRHHGQ